MAAPNRNTSPPHDIRDFSDLDGASGTEEDGIPYTTFWKFYGNGDAYFAQIFKTRLDITIDEVRDAMKKIPDPDIYPEIPEDANLKIVEASDIPNAELYIKRPSLTTYETSFPLDVIREIYIGEAQITELLSRIPHKNIVRYYGCQARDGRITGILLQRHKYTLLEYFLWDLHKSSAALDPRRFMAELGSAVAHLHANGLAHNDLKPSNILLDGDHMPVVIDFGSCRPFGGRLLEGGTKGWCDGEKLMTTSDKEHDLFGLARIGEWLEDPDRQMNG
ncbi:kinase-like protein [Xylaria bambusicola]|uniref:kinase-like protein n=1 Tax=Xylaria bambusicola TaxID=326684 RepID=UPI0020078D7C|nr:kinase-like protein [Xylaria bambusicola]KAI0516905.1 kinase-like protein [Xylaria bambusicola]